MTLAEAQAAIATALVPLAAEIPDLQVYNGQNVNPSPPALDVFPATPFQRGAGMGLREKHAMWTVRARVSNADLKTQDLLLRMLDPDDPASVEQALIDVAAIGAEGDVSGFQEYPGELIGCEWRVEVFL